MNKFYKRLRQQVQDIRVQRTLYFAYGMNTNHDEMVSRCPDSTFLGTAKMFNHKLAFQHVADYEEAKGYTLHGALWLISPTDELALDQLEGYPNHYTKHIKKVRFLNRDIDVMAYQMVNQGCYGTPSPQYEGCLKTGYLQSGINVKQIDNAISQAEEYHMEKATELIQTDIYDSCYIPVRERMKSWIR